MRKLSEKEKSILQLISSHYSDYWDEYRLISGAKVTFIEAEPSYFEFYSLAKGIFVFYTIEEVLAYYFQENLQDFEAALDLLAE